MPNWHARLIVIGELYKNYLLPQNLKAVIESLSIRVQGAAKFLDNAIKPSVENNNSARFNALLTVMMDSNDDTMKELADTINSRLFSNLHYSYS